jgi:hypothetical protein
MPLLQEVSNSKGKGKIDVYVNNLKGTPLVSLICDQENGLLSLINYRQIEKNLKKKHLEK